jgi:hypothetical protein
LAPLGRTDHPDYFEQLSSLALTIYYTLAFMMSRPRERWGFLLFGQRQIAEVGTFWSGRPHVHLLKFQDQMETAKENEDVHSASFKAIMLRCSPDHAPSVPESLPTNGRLFQDYSSYISNSLSLWVWSLSGLRQQEFWADSNNGHLVYESQAQLELLEYGYMLYRSLLERVSNYADTEDVITLRQDILKLEQQLAEASRFGEVRVLLENGWKSMGLELIRSRIRDFLEVRATEASFMETRLTTKLARRLTILFGILAIPSLANQVLKPLWKVLKLPTFSDKDVFSIFLIGTSSVIILAILMMLFLLSQSDD